MSIISDNRKSIVCWLVLILLTFLSVEVFKGFAINLTSTTTRPLMFGITLLKVRVICLEYMGISGSHIALRVLFELWLFALFLALLIIYQQPAGL